MVGAVKEDAVDGKFIESNLFSFFDKVPDVVCTKVAVRVNELLRENQMTPSECVHTYTVRYIVQKVTGALGLSASEVHDLPDRSSSHVEASTSGMHVLLETHSLLEQALYTHWKRALYKRAGSKVLECVERADRERPAHIADLVSSGNKHQCEILAAAQPHPVHHEKPGGVLNERGFLQSAMELPAKDAEIQRIRLESEMRRMRLEADAEIQRTRLEADAEIHRLRQEAELNRLKSELEAKHAEMLQQAMQAQLTAGPPSSGCCIVS
jgi:hypothetical protein